MEPFENNSYSTMTAEEFLESSTELLTATVAAVIVKIDSIKKHFMEEVGEEGISKYVEREKEFMRAVLEAYANWSKEEGNIVLWDVDDTLGRAVFLSENSYEWYFRPGMQLLMPFLKSKYPDIQNGILTSGNEGMKTYYFLKYSDLLNNTQFFNPNMFYSTQDVEISNEEELLAELDEIDIRSNLGTAYKYVILQELKRKNPDTHYRIIDDNAISAVVKEDGLDVYELMPSVLYG